MNSIQNFFLTFITSMVLENAVFSRALGLNRWARKQDSVQQILSYGGLFTWMSLICTCGAYFVRGLLLDSLYAKYLRAPGYLFVVLFMYLLTFFIARQFIPKYFEQILSMLPLTTFNTALFSIFYIIGNRNYTFSRSIAYALGTSFGYTIALLLLMFANRRLELSPIPKSFRGLPITLIYMGIISLALYGLLGYGIGA